MLVDWPDTVAVLGARSYFNSFFDWFPDVPPLPSNAFITVEENQTLTRVLDLMNEAAARTSDNPTDQELIASGWPSRVAEIAKMALETMMVRGKLPDDVEAL